MTKKEFTAFIKKMGGTTSYSGNERTMFVHGVKNKQEGIAELARTNNLPFTIKMD